MDDISARADVSKRTVYNHFDSKDALFQDIVAALWERAMQVAERPYDPTIPVREQLVALARAKVQMLSHPEFVGLARMALVAYFQSEALAREAFERMESEGRGLVRWIRAAADDARLAVDRPAEAATQLSALLKAFAFWPQVLAGQPAPDAAEREAIASSAVDMFLARYARPGEGRG